MSNKYIFIGDNKIAGPLKMQNPEERQYSYGGAYKAAMDSYSNYIASLPKIEVVKEPTHSWEINQILVEGVDVRIEQVNMIQRRCKPSGVNTKEAISKTVAVPISKPNTDVKGDGLQKYRDNVDNRPCHEIAIEKAIKEAYIPSKLQEIFDACSEEEKAAFNKSKIVRSEPNPVKEGERLYSKEDMIGFAEWILNNCRMGSFNWKLLSEEGKGIEYTSEQLFNHPEFKNNQL